MLDDHILDLADSTMAYAWLGHWHNRLSARMNPAWRENYIKWALLQYEKVNGELGRVSGDLFHLWHGTRMNRRYLGSWESLALCDYRPSTDIRLDSNRLWTWRGDKEQIQALVRHYFRHRREDGV